MISRPRHGQRVLVTGARLPAALEIIRAIHTEGAEIWAADSLRITPASVSRFVTGYLYFPSPALSFKRFSEFICDAVHKLGIELIIPVSEEIFFLAALKEALAPAILFAPPLDQLRMLHSKWDILNMATECNIRVPHTLRATSRQELSEALEEIPNSILKPEFSRGALEVFFPPHHKLDIDEISKTRPWLVQEKLAGREISTYCVTHKGRVLIQSMYVPLYRVGHGASLYFLPIHLPNVALFVTAFARKHSLTGQFSFDIMEDSNGSITLIECNPRTTSGVHLMPPDSHWGGVFWGDEVLGVCTHTQPCTAKFAVLLFHTLPALREKRWKVLIADLLVARDSLFSVDDALPVVASYLSVLEILWHSRAWSVSGYRAFTHDLEWNGSADDINK
jgi:hypothetical protein